MNQWKNDTNNPFLYTENNTKYNIDDDKRVRKIFLQEERKKRNENKTKITMKLQIYFLTNCKDKIKKNKMRKHIMKSENFNKKKYYEKKILKCFFNNQKI